MRPNEEYVLKVLVSKFGGTVTEGDDPPDAYLMLGNKRVAVEVTRLVQQLVSEDGASRPRIKDDMPALKLANELDEELRNQIPDDNYVFLILSAPIRNVRKTKKDLSNIILEKIKTSSNETDFDIGGNRVSIKIYNTPRPSGKKVIAAIANRYSSADIGSNAQFLLEERISTKNTKCAFREEIDEYWLALFNDYWIADEGSYRSAYESINIDHDFSKIYVVNGGGEVFQLC